MTQFGRPKAEHPKDNRITIRLTSEQMARLEAYASMHHMNKTQVLMMALENMLRREEDVDRS